MTRPNPARRALPAALAAVALAVAAVPATQAQMPMDPMMQQGGMPGMMPGAMPQQPGGKVSFKQIFAGTLATVLNTTGMGVAGALTQALSGAITGWFSRPPASQPALSTPGYAGTAPDPNAGMGMPGGMPGTMPPGASGMGMPGGMPADPNAMGMPGGMPADPAMQTGMGGMGPGTPGMDGGMGAAPGMMGAAPAPTIYAGLAFEVQAQGPDGSTQTVDPATYQFATGDRFVVMYRPSLPGRVVILNVNPLGQEKQIDAVNVAAGELARLGPYEFRDNTGDEQLRLVLEPCRTDALIAATRDIVKVDSMLPTGTAAAAPAGMPGLAECAAPGTRGVRPRPATRDIAKVESEGGTMFALDPVSAQEMQSGDLAAREITIRFMHR